MFMMVEKETQFFFGGLKQILLLILSFILLVTGLGIVGFWGLTWKTFVWGAILCILGAIGIQYYSGYYHRWLSPEISAEVHGVFRGGNSGLEACVHQVLELLRAAQKEVLILSGTLKSDFYELDSVVQGFKECIEKGVTIKALVGKDIDPNTRKILEMLREPACSTDSGVRIFHQPNAQPTPYPHFMVIDRMHIRIEDKHELTTSIDRISADPIKWYSLEEAERFGKAFDLMWDASSSNK
jgi:hypothetical protein